MAAVSNQQLVHEAAQLQQSFISFEQSIPEMSFQEQWNACEQIHKMQAQFDEFLSKVESSPSFQNNPSIEQTRAKLELTSRKVHLAYGQIQLFNHWYGLINDGLRTIPYGTVGLRSIISRTDNQLNALLEPIKSMPRNPMFNDTIKRAFEQLAEKTITAFRSGQTSLNPANPLTDSLVEQLDNEKKKLDRTDFGGSTGEFKTYLPFFEKLRKTSKDYPDLKEKNLTFIQMYSHTYFQLTCAISMHNDHLWEIPRPSPLEESREMTKSLAAVIDRTDPV